MGQVVVAHRGRSAAPASAVVSESPATSAGHATSESLATPVSPTSPRSRVMSLHAVLRAAATRRFRSAARRRLRSSARQAMPIILLAAVIDCVWLLPDRVDYAAAIIAANLLPVVAALLAYVALTRLRSRSMELVLLAVLMSVDAAIGVVARIDTHTALLAAGYALVLPPLVALLLPWSTRTHVTWLALHVALVGGLGFAVPGQVAVEGGPRVLVGLLIVTSAVSLVGHLANLRARVDGFLQIQQIGSMNREMRRRDVRLTALNALLERAAVTDELTGLGNRVALQRQLRMTRSRVDRYGDRFAIVMLDLDNFKSVNDTIGHSGGDDVLRRAAQALHQATRVSDGAYRFGGEEFLAIARLEGDDGAATVAERYRLAVEALGIRHEGNVPFGVVTVSVGATVVERGRLGESDDDWLHGADTALYEAKRRGRNQTVVG